MSDSTPENSDPQDTGTPAVTDPAPEPEPQEPGAPTEPEAPEEGGDQGEQGDDDQPMSLADARRIRRENQKLREGNKAALEEAVTKAAAEAAEKAAAKAREEAEAQFAERQAELAKKFGQALGVLPAEETAEEPKEVDPAELLEQAAARAAESDARAAQAAAGERAAKVALAVHTHAGQADPVALLDSNAFTKAIEALDPSSDGFKDQLTAAIDSAVEANPRLLKPTAPPSRSGADMSAGNGDPDAGGPEPDDIESLRERRSKRRAAQHN